jgi:hypothetical protein
MEHTVYDKRMIKEETRTHERLVSRPRNTMTFADGSCEVRSRSEEEAMQGHRRRRATQRLPATPISPKGGGRTVSISLSLLLHDAQTSLSSLRDKNLCIIRARYNGP